MGLSKSTVARIETGEKVPTDTELKTILGALGVVGNQRESVLEAWQETQRSNWLATGVTGLPEQLTTLIDYELSARQITEVSLAVVPGLLQTRKYSRAIYIAAGVAPGEIDTRATIRAGRQEILIRDNPIRFRAIVAESVLRRPIGGHEVLLGQLRHIVTMGQRLNVTIQVVPTAIGAHAAINGSYVLIEFDQESPVVHLEQHRVGTFLDERDDVEAYERATKTLLHQALSPAESAGMISDGIAELESIV